MKKQNTIITICARVKTFEDWDAVEKLRGILYHDNANCIVFTPERLYHENYTQLDQPDIVDRVDDFVKTQLKQLHKVKIASSDQVYIIVDDIDSVSEDVLEEIIYAREYTDRGEIYFISKSAIYQRYIDRCPFATEEDENGTDTTQGL